MAREPLTLRIRKYANRRFYDATRSCNVTLAELYDRVCDGDAIEVTDAKTGEDLTNPVLLQMILERDATKLTVFPPAILHQIIRTQHQFLGSVVEQFFRQALEAQRATQEQWQRFFANTLGAAPPGGPADWTRSWMNAFGTWRPPPATEPAPEPGRPPEPPEPPESADREETDTRQAGDRATGDERESATGQPDPGRTRDEELLALRRQLRAMTERLERLADSGTEPAPDPDDEA